MHHTTAVELWEHFPSRVGEENALRAGHCCIVLGEIRPKPAFSSKLCDWGCNTRDEKGVNISFHIFSASLVRLNVDRRIDVVKREKQTLSDYDCLYGKRLRLNSRKLLVVRVICIAPP